MDDPYLTWICTLQISSTSTSHKCAQGTPMLHYGAFCDALIQSSMIVHDGAKMRPKFPTPSDQRSQDPGKIRDRPEFKNSTSPNLLGEVLNSDFTARVSPEMPGHCGDCREFQSPI